MKENEENLEKNFEKSNELLEILNFRLKKEYEYIDQTLTEKLNVKLINKLDLYEEFRILLYNILDEKYLFYKGISKTQLETSIFYHYQNFRDYLHQIN